MKYTPALYILPLLLASCSLSDSYYQLEDYSEPKPETPELRELRLQRNQAKKEVGSYFNTILFSGKKIPNQATVAQLKHHTEKAGPIKRTNLAGDIDVTYNWTYGILDLPLFGSLFEWQGSRGHETIPFQTWLEE